MLDREAAVRILLSALLTSSIHLSAVFYLQENQKNANAIMDTNYPESILHSKTGPNLTDPNLRAEVVFNRLTYPTDMAFLGNNDILVIEKDTGIVRRIVNGTMLQKPLLDVNVATFGHRGMLGITTSNMPSSISTPPPHDRIFVKNIENNGSKSQAPNTNYTKYVFFYYTAIQGKDGEDITQGKQPLGNVVYRYEFADNIESVKSIISNNGSVVYPGKQFFKWYIGNTLSRFYMIER